MIVGDLGTRVQDEHHPKAENQTLFCFVLTKFDQKQ